MGSGGLIPVWLRNLALGWGLTDYAKMRYNLLGNGGTWFPDCHAGHLEDFDISGSIAKSPFADHIPAGLREAHAMFAAPPKKRLSQN